MVSYSVEVCRLRLQTGSDSDQSGESCSRACAGTDLEEIGGCVVSNDTVGNLVKLRLKST